MHLRFQPLWRRVDDLRIAAVQVHIIFLICTFTLPVQTIARREPMSWTSTLLVRILSRRGLVTWTSTLLVWILHMRQQVTCTSTLESGSFLWGSWWPRPPPCRSGSYLWGSWSPGPPPCQTVTNYNLLIVALSPDIPGTGSFLYIKSIVNRGKFRKLTIDRMAHFKCNKKIVFSSKVIQFTRTFNSQLISVQCFW